MDEVTAIKHTLIISSENKKKVRRYPLTLGFFYSEFGGCQERHLKKKRRFCCKHSLTMMKVIDQARWLKVCGSALIVVLFATIPFFRRSAEFGHAGQSPWKQRVHVHRVTTDSAQKESLSSRTTNHTSGGVVSSGPSGVASSCSSSRQCQVSRKLSLMRILACYR